MQNQSGQWSRRAESTWNDYLKKVLDGQFKAPWKTSLIDASGKTLDTMAWVEQSSSDNKHISNLILNRLLLLMISRS